MTDYDRESPLFERIKVPFESISSDGKSQEHYTVRILQGHRPLRNANGRERVFRFEMSDECNLVKTTHNFEHAVHGCKTPIGNSQPGQNLHRTPHAPVIHAPFMTADRSNFLSHGYIDNIGPNFNQMQISQKPNAITNQPIQIFELEVGESDFEELRRDQALLVDFNDFANALIALMQYCWDEENANDPNISSENATSHNEYPYDRPMSASQLNSNGFPSGNMTAHDQYQRQFYDQVGRAEYNSRSNWNQQQAMRYASPYGKPPISKYSCRIETSPIASENPQWRKNNNSVSSTHVRFSIVESNQFRELTHLALTLNVGTDKSIREYLSSRLSQAMAEVAEVGNQLHLQQQRCNAAEREAIEINKRIGDMSQAFEAEKYQLQCQAENRFQTENSCRFAEINDIKSTKDAEIKALKEDLTSLRNRLENKVRALEEANRNANADKAASQSENERLASQLSQQETSNQLLTSEITSLQNRLEKVLVEKSSTEKNLRELQILLASLETSNIDHKNAISQSEAQIQSTERVYADAKQTISRQHAQIDELQRRVTHSEAEASRYKELSERYQVNRAEMKKRAKENAETIRQHEKDVRNLEHRAQSLANDLKRVQEERDKALIEVSNNKIRMEGDAKKLENNQQVIAWLNKQVGKNSSSGVIFATPKPTPHSALQSLNTNQVMTSSLSRYLPNSSLTTTPYRQDTGAILKPISVPKEPLHPAPHPL